jgi:hypothetical protein
MTANDREPSTYFGLYSPNQRARATDLLARIGVRFEFVQVKETEDRLRSWTAWDESSASSQTGYELFIRSADLERLGTQLVDLFPERKFGEPKASIDEAGPMNDHYITISELLALLGVFVAPFICVAGVAQFLVLRRVQVRPGIAALIVTGGAALTIPLTFALTWVVPSVTALEFKFGFGGVLVLPALLSVAIVTLLIAVYTWVRARKPAA